MTPRRLRRMSSIAAASLLTAVALPASASLPGAFAAPHVAIVAAPLAAQGGSWEALRERFTRMARVLRTAGGVLDSDLGLVRDLLTDVRAFNDANPDHRSALALELQLARWVGDDTKRIGDLYAALARLTGDDAELALSAFRYRVQNNLIEEGERLAETQALLERFPGNRDVLREAVRKFQESLMYEEIVQLLDGADLNPETDHQLMMQHAEALFAAHAFERSATIAQRLSSTEGLTPALKRQADALVEDAQKYQSLWEEEQAIRAAETEADDLPRLVIETSRGSITLELFENEAPNTVANFISLAESDFYAGTRFHRFVTNMMIQGGDPDSKEGPGIARGMGGPGYTIADEHGRSEERMHFRDSIAMAKTNEPDTGGSQFYLCHRPLPWLNSRHTVFGRVIDGLATVRALRQDDEIHAVIVLRKRDHDYEPVVMRDNDDAG